MIVTVRVDPEDFNTAADFAAHRKNVRPLAGSRTEMFTP